MGKKVKGRKRHLLVDVDGLLLACKVHSAAIQERAGAKLLLRQTRRTLDFSARRLRLIWADSGYWGAPFAAWVQARWKRVRVEAVARNKDLPNRKDSAKPDFVQLPRRGGGGERTFAWLARFRRLSRDYERLPTTLAGLSWLAFRSLLLSNLFKTPALTS